MGKADYKYHRQKIHGDLEGEGGLPTSRFFQGYSADWHGSGRSDLPDYPDQM